MHCSLTLFLSLASSSAAFTTRRSALVQPRFSTLPLNVGYTLDLNSNDEMFLMQRAYDCADSDSCSLEEAKTCLSNVIHIQSDCAGGVLVGSDVCDNADTSAELVAGLREKIDQQLARVRMMNTGGLVANVSLTAMLLSVFVAGVVASNPDVASFTPEEWWWAIRDGYLPNMLVHYFRNGGLAKIDYEPETSPFVLQEWWWAIQGGYFNTMVEHFFRNGGLASVAGGPSETAAITTQEWIWSMQGGYLDTLLAQNFETGGLSTGSFDTDVVPFTPQEWAWAAKHGYLGDMVSHYSRNGGL